MARHGVTFEKVANIANVLAAEDVNPTVDRIREKLGTGSKSTIAKHLKRWRTQAELSNHPLTHYDPEQMPDALMTLMQDFWQSFYRTQVADDKTRREMPPFPDAFPPQSAPLRPDQPSGYYQTAEPRTLASHHALQEQMQLIQDYVVGLEAELAESTALQHRLAHRLSAYYAPDAITPNTATNRTARHAADKDTETDIGTGTGTGTGTDIEKHSDSKSDLEYTRPQVTTNSSAEAEAISIKDLADPELYKMPILSELAAIQAALNRAETAHGHLTEDLDWATRSAFNLATTEADLRSKLNTMQQLLDASTVRETALAAENDALKSQITHLRRALALRQRFIERLEGDVLAFRPTEQTTPPRAPSTHYSNLHVHYPEKTVSE